MKKKNVRNIKMKDISELSGIEFKMERIIILTKSTKIIIFKAIF